MLAPLLLTLFIQPVYAADYALHVADPPYRIIREDAWGKPPVDYYHNYEYVQEEVHPYDQPDRRHGSRRRSYRARYNFRTDPYFQRTETHALHPYYRNHYHDILTVTDTSREAEIGRQSYLNNFPYFHVPIETNCAEYSFYKAHNRLPPKNFNCIRP